MYPLIPPLPSTCFSLTKPVFSDIVNVNLPGIKEYIREENLDEGASHVSIDFDLEQVELISKLLSMDWALSFCYHQVSKKIEAFIEKVIKHKTGGLSEEIITTDGWNFTDALTNIETAYEGLIVTNTLLNHRSVKVTAVAEPTFNTFSKTSFFTPPALERKNFKKAPIDHLLKKGYVIFMEKTNREDIFSLEFKCPQFQEFSYFFKEIHSDWETVGLANSR